MDEVAAFGLVCFVSLFAVVEPLGLIPFLIGMTGGLAPARQRAGARRAVLVALLTQVLFALSGQFLFRHLGISADSMKVVGGMNFFQIGYEILQARHTRTAVDEASAADAEGDLPLTPLGIPMIAGPGAITNVIVRWNEADGLSKQAVLLGAILAVMFMTLALLPGARRVTRVLGDSGNRVLLRLMGLITLMIAVELFFSGLTPTGQRMLKLV